MSKKLIAVATAAALALSALAGIAPATALPLASSGTSFLDVTNETSGTGTAADPYLEAVPEAGTVASASILTFTVSSTSKRKAASVTSTSGIKLLDAPGDSTNKYTSASGSASLSLTTTDTGSLVFYGFPTSTTTGIVTLTIDGDVTQAYIKGVAGAAYAIKSVTAPTSVTPEGKGTFVAVLVDAFGNTVTTGELAVTVVGGGSSTFADEAAVANKITYSTTSERHAGVLTAGATAGTIAIQATLAGTATDAQKTAFGTPVRNYFTTITTASLADQITALTAQVTALKADYNKLAARWNKLVASKKAPKKAVATK
jgi:hypothetical protein